MRTPLIAAGLTTALLVSTTGQAHAVNAPHDWLAWQAKAMPVTNRLLELGQLDPAYTGLRADTAKGQIIVYRQGGAADDRYTSLAKAHGLDLVFRPAATTAKQTADLMDRIWAARPELSVQGIRVTAVTTDGTGTVTVGVRELTAATTTTAAFSRFATLGADTIRFEQADPGELAHRFNDSAPYFGGNRIVSATGLRADGTVGFVGCTSGFGGRNRNDGQHYILTAYHCAKPGDPRFWTANEDHQGQHALGSAALDPGHDLAWIRSWTVPSVWDGPIRPYSAQFTKRVSGMSSPVPGFSICTSGSYTGVRCYAEIMRGGHIDMCGNWAGQPCWDAYLYFAGNGQGQAMCQHGDSGGPVFTPNEDRTTVTAVGIISWASRAVGSLPYCNQVGFPAVYNEAFLRRGIDLRE